MFSHKKEQPVDKVIPMLTDEQRQILIAMQCITVPEGITIPAADCHQVWEWSNSVLKAHSRLRRNSMRVVSIERESIENAYQKLMEVLARRVAIHVVNGEVCICPLNELPRDRVELFQKALAEMAGPGQVVSEST
jgi:hypothetical protein